MTQSLRLPRLRTLAVGAALMAATALTAPAAMAQSVGSQPVQSTIQMIQTQPWLGRAIRSGSGAPISRTVSPMRPVSSAISVSACSSGRTPGSRNPVTQCQRPGDDPTDWLRLSRQIFPPCRNRRTSKEPVQPWN